MDRNYNVFVIMYNKLKKISLTDWGYGQVRRKMLKKVNKSELIKPGTGELFDRVVSILE